MDKIKLVLLAVLSFVALSAFANSPCDNACQKAPCQKTCEAPCFKSKPTNNCFLFTNKTITTMFNCMNLSDTQECYARKIQENYNLEVLSLNDRLQCEKQKLCQMKIDCANWFAKYKQKRVIHKLEKEIKKICKCYEKQFLTSLSQDQQRAYKKFKRNK